MAKFQQGINGPFSGKIGNIIGSSWRGIHYMKSRSKKRTKKSSPKQVKNEQEFAIAHHWLSPLLEFVREGFRHPSRSNRGFLAAKSYLLKNALVRKGSDSYIIPSQMLVSKGSLPMPADLSMHFDAAASQINIHWHPVKTDDPDASGYASYNDQVMCVAYNVEAKDATGDVFGALRKAGQSQITLQEKGKYHIYLAFHAADRKDQSDSRYLGEVELT